MTELAHRLLDWYDHFGRDELPWRRHRDPYRIWVSEIMLQQTQVSTVIPYYERFVARFPTIARLAAADLDGVLHRWTGLGYYARARNLHKAAQLLVAEHGGEFPRDFEVVCRLPGIGRSTAGAILAFAHHQRHPVLDGNVKRVLTRYHRLAGWPGHRTVEQRLWVLADEHTPHRRIADYTQAIMDLGATVCRRRRPRCDTCPLHASCAAFAHGDPHAYPAPAPTREKPVKAVAMVMIQKGSHVLLEQRPPHGVWGGLWGFPECEPDTDIPRLIAQRYGLSVRTESHWSRFRHTFSHFHLDITPVPARTQHAATRVMENVGVVWYNPSSPDERGLAAPVKSLLQKLR